MKFDTFFLALGVVCGVIAGLMTFLISYGELVKHFATKEIPVKVSLKSALVSFVFFLIMSLAIGFFIKHL
jgi:uncharacterized protein with PQ loop repeat